MQYPEVSAGIDWRIRTVPVVSIFGTADKYLSVEAAKGSRDYVTNFSEVFIDGASHFVHVEKPKHVNNIMEEILIDYDQLHNPSLCLLLTGEPSSQKTFVLKVA